MLSLSPNDKIEKQPVVVRQISKKVGQNNKEYYHLHISYGIKSFDAKIWSGDESIVEGIIPGCYANIWGTAKEFKNNLQIHITKIEKIENPDSSLVEEVTPASKLSEEFLLKEINDIIATVKDSFLNQLLNNIFNSDLVKNNFYDKAAGIEIHHAFKGGLAQHTIEVTKFVSSYCSVFQSINYDIAITAALLHDIGKVVELSSFPENKYTDAGRLLGHISIGASLINDNIVKITGFPEELKCELLHCILSHHGNLEMGSPVVPMTLEAVALSNADKTSAELNGFSLAIQRDTNTSAWTDYHPMYKRYIKK